MMPITLNILSGLIAGLIGLAVGLATMLLVLWQAPHQRDNQLMVLYMASVAVWGLAALLLNLAVMVEWEPQRFHQFLIVTIALNCYNTFLLAVHFAQLRSTPLARAALVFGTLGLLIVIPLILLNKIVVLHAITSEGLFVYDFTPMSLPFMALLIIYYVAALAIIWRHRQGPAGQLLLGDTLIVGGVILSLVPRIGAYPIDVLTSAVASLLFARSILKNQLFGPLAQLNAELATSNAQLIMLSEGLQATADELRYARDAAEASSIAKSQFLATMSHELRTPLTSIIGYSDLIRLQIQQGDQVNLSDIEAVSRAGKHLLELINDVLDVAKIEAGKADLDLSTFDVATLIEDLAEIIRPLAAKNGNSLVVLCDKTIGSMVSDATKLRQMLLNLLSNAAKFTNQGTIELMVSRSLVNNLEVFSFRITDTGIGIAPEQLGKLFQTFMQADSTVTRKYGGTGLGLALSQRLCRLMGGEINVSSEPGVGSTFIATLPARLERPG